MRSAQRSGARLGGVLVQHAARAARGAVQQLAPGVVPQLGVRPQAVAHRLSREETIAEPDMNVTCRAFPLMSTGHAGTSLTVLAAESRGQHHWMTSYCLHVNPLKAANTARYGHAHTCVSCQISLQNTL